PIRMRSVSPPSFKTRPRRGTFNSPKATCSTTAWPIQGWYALSIRSPSENNHQREENHAEARKPAMVQRGYGTRRKVLLGVWTSDFGHVSVTVLLYFYLGTTLPFARTGVFLSLVG